jgi:methyl-accepting chemotaxis protein
MDPANDMLFKGVLSGSALVALISLVIINGKAAAEKDRLFTEALNRFGERLNGFGEKFQAAMDRISATIQDVDKAHSSQTIEATRQWAGINERQNTMILSFGQKVDRLEDRVGRLSETIEDQGEKIDAIARSLPSPAGGASFPVNRGRDAGDPRDPRPA